MARSLEGTVKSLKSQNVLADGSMVRFCEFSWTAYEFDSNSQIIACKFVIPGRMYSRKKCFFFLAKRAYDKTEADNLGLMQYSSGCTHGGSEINAISEQWEPVEFSIARITLQTLVIVVRAPAASDGTGEVSVKMLMLKSFHSLLCPAFKSNRNPLALLQILIMPSIGMFAVCPTGFLKSKFQ